MDNRDGFLPAQLLEYDKRKDDGVQDALQLRLYVETQAGADARFERKPACVLGPCEDGLALQKLWRSLDQSSALELREFTTAP